MSASEFKNSFSKREYNNVPMKMLSAQDTSIEMETRQNPPNLVAKLMGLEALPRQQPISAVLRNHARGHPRNRSDVSMSSWEQESGFLQYLDPNEHKVVCEVLQRSQKSPHVAYEETINDRKMGLVRQKFIEAKRLSMNEKLRQSKQFQDALEVLSSNKDLFLKCLQESHSMFSENLYSRKSDAHPAETKRITILRPSKRAECNDFVEVENKNAKKIKKGDFLQLNGLEKVQPGSSSPESFKNYRNPSPPTQIVVLRPTRKKACDDIAVGKKLTVGSPYSEQPMMLHREDFFGRIEDNEDQESREVAKEIAQQMHDKFGQHCKDENLISSVLLNGHVDDESSFHKLENEYVGDHICDSEAMFPASRHSRDYVDRLSPCSTSPFSRPSYSPETSVCREAKKRLSERWAMMASNEIGQEQRQYQRSSSTLRDMLALPETKPVTSHGEEGASSQVLKDSDFLSFSEWRGEEKMDNSPRNLIRSKSVPVSGGFGTRLNIGSSDSVKGKSESCMEDTKASSTKLSLREKVSSLFFSSAKKPDKEKSLVSQTGDEFHLYPGDGDINTTRSLSVSDKGYVHASPLLEQSRRASSSNPICTKMTSPENILVTEIPITSGRLGENLDQPSPICVLGSSFEEDGYLQKTAPYYAKHGQQGVESPLLSVGSHLIGKSPPIESIARCLSWNSSFVNTDSSHPPKKLIAKETDEEEQECFIFVKALLSEAGLHGEACPTSSLTRWYSLESPLDPSLRGKSIDFTDEKELPDAKLRQKRAVQNLVYDCANAAIVNAGCKTHLCKHIGPNNLIAGGNASLTMLDEVWSQIKVWFSRERRGMLDDCWENDSWVVEKVIKKDVLGKGWSDQFRLEIDNLGKEIEERLLEELMQEVVVELKVECDNAF